MHFALFLRVCSVHKAFKLICIFAIFCLDAKFTLLLCLCCVYLLKTLGELENVFSAHKPVTPRPLPIGSAPGIATSNHVDFLSAEDRPEARP